MQALNESQGTKPVLRFVLCKLIGSQNSGSGGIRTHAIQMTGALNQRLRSLCHAT